MRSGKVAQTQREGGKWEGSGFLLILVGIGVCFISGEVGLSMIMGAFVVFLVGRFMYE